MQTIERSRITPEQVAHYPRPGMLVPGNLHYSRSEERRVGKECRSRGSPHHKKKKHAYDMTLLDQYAPRFDRALADLNYSALYIFRDNYTYQHKLVRVLLHLLSFTILGGAVMLHT